jgi:predicted ester cyclase
MSMEEVNKAVVSRWFAEFWGEHFNPDVVDELAAADIYFQYTLHRPASGRAAVKEFMTKFRESFPDLNFWGTSALIAEGDYVVGRWEGGGTHTGAAFDDLPIGSLPEASGKAMRFIGTTTLKLRDGLIVEEIGFDDGVKALQQLGIILAA